MSACSKSKSSKSKINRLKKINKKNRGFIMIVRYIIIVMIFAM